MYDNKRTTQRRIVAGAAVIYLVGAIIMWILSFSQNGAGHFFVMNVLVGTRGVRDEDKVTLQDGKADDYSFVSYDAFADLSLYVETEGVSELKSTLYNSDWEMIKESRIEIPSETKGFIQVFDDLSVAEGRTVYILRIEKAGGDGKIQVASRNGGTAVYASGGIPFTACLYVVVCLLLLLMVTGVYYCAVYREYPVKKVFLAAALPMVVLFSLLLYPGTACDENDHYVEAYKLSNRMLSVDENMIREEDLSIVANRWAVPSIEGVYLTLNQVGHRTVNEALVVNDHRGHAGNAVVYMLPAIGITFSRMLSFNAFTTYCVARGMNVLFYLVSGYLSLSICSYGKGILLVFLLLPLTLNQCISVNQDSFCFCISFLSIAFWTCLKNKKQKGKRVSVSDLIFLLVLSSLLLASKAYVIILGIFSTLVLAEIKEFVKSPKTVLICGVAVAVVVCVFLLIGNSGYIQYFKTALFGKADGSRYSLRYYLNDPLTGIKIFAATFKQQWFQWFWDAFGSKLSWQTYFSPIYAIGFAVVLSLLALSESGGNLTSNHLERVITFLIEAAFFALVYLRASTWTEVGRSTIWGIQGRYFIPVLPLVFYAMIGKKDTVVPQKTQRYLYLSVSILLMFVCFNLLSTKVLVYLSE